jgi:superfamily II DNA/RNA helicase
MSFKDLGLSEQLLKAIEDCGYTEPTPIQKQAIPPILMGRDVVGLAQTGTGKTAGFTLPMIEILQGGRARARMPRSLVLTPTRELAAQVSENFDTYGKYHKLTMALLVGGVSMEEQIKKLDRGVDVLVATPGRLLDLFDRGKILLSDIKILVIDEADRMMDMGFIPDIEKIVGMLPVIRQTLLFSATMPPEIKRLTQKFQSNPKEIAVARPSATAEKVKQHLVWTHPKRKRETLHDIIKKENVQNAFVFCNRKRDIGDLTRWLQAKGFSAREMHGDMVQSARTKTLEEFKTGTITLLVCSDVAARGLDVDDLSHVFNYDVPINAEDYVHRIGRTGRAGKEGRAWTLATRDEEKQVTAIKKLIQKDIEEINMESGGSSSGGGDRDRPRPQEAREPRREQNRDRSRDRPREREQEPRREKAEPIRQGEKSPEAKSYENNPKPERRENLRKEPGVQGFGDDVPGFFGGKN